jgi:hypothetical protein
VWCIPVNLGTIQKILGIRPDEWKGRIISLYLKNGKKAIFMVWVQHRQVHIIMRLHADEQFRKLDENVPLVLQMIHNVAATTWFQDQKFMETLVELTHCTWIFNIDWSPREITVFYPKWTKMLPKFDALNQTMCYQIKLRK